jgi:XTP/dITP diphosphohydrolase
VTRRLLVASRNAKKLDELHRILVTIDLGDVELLSLADVPDYEEVPETGVTFEDNALLKAREGARYSGLLTVADDSGLAVDALNGMPGVLSARWSGGHGDDAANLALVLAQIRDVPAERRGAAFVCAAALVTPDGGEDVVTGRVDGTLTTEPRGDQGFGYDPIFVPTGHSRTTAEMPAAEKDQLSHRGRALRALAGPLTKALATSTGAS